MDHLRIRVALVRSVVVAYNLVTIQVLYSTFMGRFFKCSLLHDEMTASLQTKYSLFHGEITAIISYGNEGNTRHLLK